MTAVTASALMLVLMIPTATSQPGIIVYIGYATGQQFREMNERHQQAYVAGVSNGMLLAENLEAPDAFVAALAECIRDMTYEQITAISLKYLDNYSERVALPCSAYRTYCP